jgi:DNA polymerase (family 10)
MKRGRDKGVSQRQSCEKPSAPDPRAGPILAHNEDIARSFDEVADILELTNENPFRIRAYRNAARVLRGLGKEVGEMLQQGQDLAELPGIGKDLAEQIAEMTHTGRLAKLDDLASKAPPLALELSHMPGIGPKRAMRLCKELRARTMRDIRHAAESGRISKLRGFGAKMEQSILSSLKAASQQGPPRYKLAAVQGYADAMLSHLSQAPGFLAATVAGSFRRRKETVGDLDIIVAASNGKAIIDWFVHAPDVARVISAGPTRGSVALRSGLQIDVRAVSAESYGAALVYFTGSKAHNIALRRLAQEKDLKINEYGVFRGEKAIAGRTEASVYASVGLPLIEPELREDQGEIEAAISGNLPDLVKLEDILGDLHVHTNESDGTQTFEEMATAAKKRGLHYIAVTDHSHRVTIAHGLTADRLLAQVDRIDAFNAKNSGVTVLKGVEVDILEDGALDLPDSILSRLDLVVGAIHSYFGLSQSRQTERILRAMDHPHFTILAHPTGRLLLERDAFDVDMARIIRAARARGCFLELNAYPDRLDLNDLHCRMAKAEGVSVSINSDAHRVEDFANLRFGVGQARRGWLEKKDVLNTRPLSALRRLLKQTM